MLSVQQARSIIAQNLPPPQQTHVTIGKALGYVLAKPVLAERDYPPFDRITHDGIAICFDAYAKGQRQFPVETYAAAGAARFTLANPDACIEVATGAPLPAGCDTVIPYELVQMDNKTAVIGDTPIKAGNSLHPRASDIKSGQQVLEAGVRIGALEIAVLASNGITEPTVFQQPRIGILATGDELVGIDAPVADHQIRRSNDVTLSTALKQNGFTEVETGWVPDNQNRIRHALEEWLATQDVLLITGGVSRGTYDYVPGILASLGVQALFHNVAQRPGKPLWFGKSREGKIVFGLPGNPVSCLTCLIRYALPALRHMSGEREAPAGKVKLADNAKAHPTLALFTPVRMGTDYGSVVPVPNKGSGDFTGLLGSAGFIELAPRDTAYAAGETVDFFPWRAM